jgi:fumarate reductase flavoprotein subunit
LMDHGFTVLPGHPVLGQGHEPYSQKRYYWGADGGRTILAVLRRELQPWVDQGRVDVSLSTPVTALLTNDAGDIEAVRVKSGLAETVFRGRHVLLACGGYVSNPQLFEKLSGVRDYGDNGYPYSQGAGIELGMSVGGFVRGRENYLSNFGSILADDQFPAKMFARFVVIPQQRQPWEIFVNARGERWRRRASVDFRARRCATLSTRTLGSPRPTPCPSSLQKRASMPQACCAASRITTAASRSVAIDSAASTFRERSSGRRSMRSVTKDTRPPRRWGLPSTGH